jgi:endonuclease/exonuclease/phosphatase family metal-dependent hydrolase
MTCNDYPLTWNADPMNLKVLTYNIHKGMSPGNIKFILPKLKDELLNLAPDIIFFQEIRGEYKRRTSQFEYFADELWPHHAYGKNAIYKNGHHGNAILSRYPFVAWENLDISKMKFSSRSLLHGTVSVPDFPLPIHLICLHFGLFEFERRSQIEALCRRIEEHVPHEEPLIVGGDFNDWNGKIDDQLRTQLELHEVFLKLKGQYAKTFPSWFPVLPVDRLYVRNLLVKDSRCLKNLPWKRLSDHLALLTTLNLSPERKSS